MRAWTSRFWVLGVLVASCLGGAVCTGAAAWGQERPRRVLVSPKRLVKLFNFESKDASGQKVGASHQLPQHWYVIGRPAGTSSQAFSSQPLNERLVHMSGFPAYGKVGFSSEYHTSGDYSFHVGLNGGSAGAFLEVGTLPAVPGSDYVVTARVRTAKLKHAAAYVVGYFVDSDGKRIERSMRQTRALRTKGKWTTVAVKLPGRFEQAAWIGLQLEVLQPRRSAHSVLGEDQIVLQDVHGGAWFDDIAVWQVPHVEVKTQSEVNVIRGPSRPQLQMAVRDLTGEALEAKVTVFGVDRQVAATQVREVGAGYPGQWTWRPALPGYGWYRIRLEVRSRAYGDRGGAIARTVGAFAWLPGDAGAQQYDLQKFGLVGLGMDLDRAALMPKLLKAAGLGRLMLSVWERKTTVRDLASQQQRLGAVLGQTMVGGRRVGLSLWPVPEALRASAGVTADEPLAVMATGDRAWMNYLTPAMRWQGQDVHEWMIGDLRDPMLFFDSSLPGSVDKLSKQLRSLVPGPRVVLSWRLSQSQRADMPGHALYAINVSPAVAPREMPGYLKSWQRSGAAYWLDLREPPATRERQVDRVRDLALRMLYGWSSGRSTMMLNSPWTGAATRATALLPDPLLAVFSNTAARLAGRRYLGGLPIGAGLKAMIFDGPDGGMLAVWNRKAPAASAKMDMYLGQSPVVYDVFGNRHAVRHIEGRSQVRVTRMPRFICGINPELALLRASFKLKPSFIESLARPHKAVLVVTNPWHRTMSGTMRIVSPKGWEIHPRQRTFSVASGQTLELPLTLSFPIDAVAGSKRLTARVKFTADKSYDVLLSTPMKLGLTDVDFDATAAVEKGRSGKGRDVVVDCVVTNTGKKTRALYVFANLRGHPRQERLIPRLGPGQSVVRRFRFADAVAQIQAKRDVWTGVRQSNGPAILNKRIGLGE